MKAIFGLCAFLICLSSCAEFVEYPLEEETVALLAPMDSLRTQDSVVTFLWQPHEDAERYRLQVARPNFEAVQKILVDTTVTKDFLELTVPVGSYSWRVRPENDGSVGVYSSRQFTILPTE